MKTETLTFKDRDVKSAIFGDCSRYAGKPFTDFISEFNHGRDIYFTDTKEHAVSWLGTV